MSFTNCNKFEILTYTGDIFRGFKPDELKHFEEQTGTTIDFQGADMANALTDDIKANCKNYLPLGESNYRFSEAHDYLAQLSYSFNVTIAGSVYTFTNVDMLECSLDPLDFDQVKETGTTKMLLKTRIKISLNSVSATEYVEFHIAPVFSYVAGKTNDDDGEVYLDHYDVNTVYQDGSQIRPLNIDFFNNENMGLKNGLEKFFDKKGLEFLE
jgi:hypothetical protein